jgi:hypothetical protein
MLLAVGEIFLEAVPLSLLLFEENLGGVSDSVGVESCLRYLLILLELGPPFIESDLVTEEVATAAAEYLLYDVEEDPLTFEGLTHSAWWESNLYMGSIFSQNSQGSITSVLPSPFSCPFT